MRLGQLARKLSVRQAEILQFLASQGVTLEDNSNTRIPDVKLAGLISRFAPSLSVEMTETLVTETEPESTSAEEIVAEPVTPIEEPTDEEALLPTSEEKPEVIKAPKVELAGLKVVGKIELPEPKKKESVVNSDAPVVNEELKPERRVSRPERRPLAPRKNPIAAQREREEQEMIRKREEEAFLRKEQKARHYQKRLTKSAPTKKVRMVEEPLMEMSETDTRPEPKTIFGKFFRWLRS